MWLAFAGHPRIKRSPRFGNRKVEDIGQIVGKISETKSRT